MVGLGQTVSLAIGATALGLTAISLPFVTPAFRRVCIPYVPATDAQIQNILKLLDNYRKFSQPALADGSKLIDLGSGDGRVVSPFIQTKTCACTPRKT